MAQRYCLDTNTFVEPWNKYFRFDRCPDYWTILDDLGKRNIVFCPDQVKREIDKIDDGLKAWLRARPYFVRDETEVIQRHVRDILKAYPLIISVGANRSMADPWVIAHAMAESATVVSKEYAIKGIQKRSRVKIPDVCSHFKVKCISDFEFIDELGIKFNASIK